MVNIFVKEVVIIVKLWGMIIWNMLTDDSYAYYYGPSCRAHIAMSFLPIVRWDINKMDMVTYGACIEMI